MPVSTNDKQQGPRAEPPRHSRPLYWSIPLPALDDKDDLYSSGGPPLCVSQPDTTTDEAALMSQNVWTSSPRYCSSHFLIRQEPMHERTGANGMPFQHLAGPYAVSAEIHVSLAPYIGLGGHQGRVVRRSGSRALARVDCLEAATNPPVSYLQVTSAIDGSSMEVFGRAVGDEEQGVVIVGDVLDAVETLSSRRRVEYQGRSLILGADSIHGRPGLFVSRTSNGSCVGRLVV